LARRPCRSLAADVARRKAALRSPSSRSARRLTEDSIDTQTWHALALLIRSIRITVWEVAATNSLRTAFEDAGIGGAPRRHAIGTAAAP